MIYDRIFSPNLVDLNDLKKLKIFNGCNPVSVGKLGRCLLREALTSSQLKVPQITSLIPHSEKFVFSGEKVIIVIGSDVNYKDADEEQSSVLSRWAYHKVASQFDEQFMDGRKSFIFSWDKEHRPIHEEALLHYFDPKRKGKKFVPKLVPVEPKGHQVDPNKVSLRFPLYTFNAEWILI